MSVMYSDTGRPNIFDLVLQVLMVLDEIVQNRSNRVRLLGREVQVFFQALVR